MNKRKNNRNVKKNGENEPSITWNSSMIAMMCDYEYTRLFYLNIWGGPWFMSINPASCALLTILITAIHFCVCKLLPGYPIHYLFGYPVLTIPENPIPNLWWAMSSKIRFLRKFCSVSHLLKDLFGREYRRFRTVYRRGEGAKFTSQDEFLTCFFCTSNR